MDCFPVKVLLPWPDTSEFKITPVTQCTFEVLIPLGLPRLIDPSLPAPPYIGMDATYNDLQIRVRPTMRAIITGLLRELMGSDYPVSSLLGYDPDPNYFESHRLLEHWSTHHLLDKADVDLKAGTWKDQWGNEGHGTIDAYVEYHNGRVDLMYGFRYILVQGSLPEGEENPRVIQFEAEPALHDGNVILQVREYTELGRKDLNNHLKRYFARLKAREDASCMSPIKSSL